MSSSSATAPTTTTSTSYSSSTQQQQLQQQQQASGTTAATTTTKKKFGKNLTKIVQSQQQAPATDHRSNTNTATNRNGLLLLSTKKATTSTASSGLLVDGTILSSGTSTGRVVGGLLSSSTTGGTKEIQTLDAWGVAAAAAAAAAATATASGDTKSQTTTAGEGTTAKAESNTTTETVSQVTTSKGLGESATTSTSNRQYPEEGAVSSTRVAAAESEARGGAAASSKSVDSNRKESTSTEKSKSTNMATPAVVPAAAWDEYGGRGGILARDAPSNKSKKIVTEILSDPDKEYMAAKARERAAELLKAEEQRLEEQRDRIAARLRELNQNSSNKSSSNANNKGNVNAASTDVGNKSAPKKVDNNDGQPNPPGAPMIHLTSYEDRDRGMPAQSSQPRMLFDPKSGAMVAVKARDESQNNSAQNKTANKKSTNSKKTQQQDSRTSNAKGARINNNSNNAAVSSSNKDSGNTTKTIRKNSDSDVQMNKVQLLKNTNPVVEPVKAKKPVPAPTPPPLLTIPRIPRSLPRTCGVLYKRHNKVSNSSAPGAEDISSFYCADGCEGDLGYGAHSVPGGRTRNPEGYAKYKQQQQVSSSNSSNRQFRSGNGSNATGKQTQSSSSKNSNAASNEAWENHHHHHDMLQAQYLRPRTYDSSTVDARGGSRSTKANSSNNRGGNTGGGGASLLFTGFNPTQTRQPEEEDDPDLLIHQQHLDWVTADDKLELVGMDDDEPTLKPTAKVFAPSKAALEAAATLRTKESHDTDDDDDDDYDDYNDSESRASIENNNNANLLIGVVGGLNDDVDDYDDEEIDEHHHQTVNKAALDILEDDEDDHHHHHGLLSTHDVDPLGLVGFEHIDVLLPKSSKAGKSRLVQLEDIPMDTSLLTPSFTSALAGDVSGGGGSSIGGGDDLNSNFNATANHTIFGFGSPGPWGANAGSNQVGINSSSDWEVDILNLTRGAGSGNNLVSGHKNTSSALFGSDNAFGMSSLVTGMPSSSWGTNGVVNFDGLNLNGGITPSGRSSSSKNGD